jgi:uncharacterized protein (TIGR03435 family)
MFSYMRCCPALGTAALAVPFLLHTQSTAPAPKFEVASIKPCNDTPAEGGRRGGGGVSAGDPGLLRLPCQPLDHLIRLAYIRFATGQHQSDGVPPVSGRAMNQRIEGSAGWISSELYTIEAKPETPQGMEMMRGPMLQALLEERFKLKLRRDRKEVSVYALMAGKGGAKLQPSTPTSCRVFDPSMGPPSPPGPNDPPFCFAFGLDPKGGMRTFRQTLAGLGMQFSAALDRDVVDRTGIEGTFDIHLDLSQDELFPFMHRERADAGPPPDSLGAITRAVQKLGLRLELAKINQEFLAIEHAERPSQN